MRRFVSILILSAGCGLAAAETPAAPFGLSWGQSRATVEAAGVMLSDCRSGEVVETCLASGLETPFEDEGVYRVSFSGATGLDTVRFVSDRVRPDRRGTVGRAIYERIHARIQVAYGESRRREKMFLIPPWQLETHFYECLRHGPRCGVWSAEWRGRGISLDLRAVPVTEGEGGYVEIVFYGPGPG